MTKIVIKNIDIIITREIETEDGRIFYRHGPEIWYQLYGQTLESVSFTEELEAAYIAETYSTKTEE